MLLSPNPIHMAEAATTSPAKPLITLSEGNIRLSVFKGPRISLQRIYQYEGKTGYAHSFRIEDLPVVKQLLNQAVIQIETAKDELVEELEK